MARILPTSEVDERDDPLLELARVVHHILFSRSATPPGTDHYLRPDGTSYFLRPDGTSLYLRP